MCVGASGKRSLFPRRESALGPGLAMPPPLIGGLAVIFFSPFRLPFALDLKRRTMGKIREIDIRSLFFLIEKALSTMGNVADIFSLLRLSFALDLKRRTMGNAREIDICLSFVIEKALRTMGNVACQDPFRGRGSHCPSFCFSCCDGMRFVFGQERPQTPLSCSLISNCTNRHCPAF